MGNGEVDTPKTPKSSSVQEQPPPTSPAIFPDWTSYQAYYNSAGTPPMAPPGFFHSSVASSPQAHPYMWGQHMMPPYGTPHPYVSMYPHGGLYAHPSIPPGSHPYAPYAMPSPNGTAETSVAGHAGAEVEGKSVEGRSKSPLKKSKASLGTLTMVTGKSNEIAKVSGLSSNGVLTQSESGKEGSSEGSDANSQNDSQQKSCQEQGSVGAEAAQNRSTVGSAPNWVPWAPSAQTMSQNMSMMAIPPNGIAGPATNLNIGMDFWGSPASIRAKVPAVPTTAAIVPTSLVGSRDGVPSEVWLQDERELKRQRRKQSNRESARRSRLRKQAECEELAKHVETLKEENSSLGEELDHIREECEKLAMENASLTARLEKHHGAESRPADAAQLDCNSQMANKIE